MSWFVDALEVVRRPVRDAYSAVESTATSLVPVVGDMGRAASSWVYEELVAVPGLTPEQAWVVFAATTLVGVGTGGGSLVVGALVRTAAKAALKQAAKRGAIAAGVTAALGWAAFAGVGGGGGGPPDDPDQKPEETVPVKPVDRQLELVVVPDGYLSEGVLLSRDNFASWCSGELSKPGSITVELLVDDNDPEHLVSFARLHLERENALRESRGMVPAKIRFTEE